MFIILILILHNQKQVLDSPNKKKLFKTIGDKIVWFGD